MENTPLPPPPAAVQSPCPNNYLVFSILTTLFCCLPTGIVAIVYSCQVNSLFNANRPEEAQNASKWALRWNIISLSLVVALCFISFIGSIAAYPAMEEMLRNNPELQQSIHDEVMRELHDELDSVPVEMRDDIIKEALDTIPGGR